MDSGLYKTTYVKQYQVIYSYYPPDSDNISIKIKADVKYIYPIGTPGFLSFEKALWVLTADDIIVIKLSLSRHHAPEVIMFSGILKKHNQVVSLHAEGMGLYGLKITMDGFLKHSNYGYCMIGVFTATVRDARHVERVELHLSYISNLPPSSWADPIIENVHQKKFIEQFTREEKVLLSEPREWISGVPIPTNFDATLKIKLNGITLPLMKGQLLLHHVEGFIEPKVGITLTTEGSLVPGWSTWITNPNISLEPDPTSIISKPFKQQSSKLTLQVPQIKDFREIGETIESGIEVTAKNGHIHVTIIPTQLFRQVSWYVTNPEYSKNTSVVVADEGTIDLKVTSECFSGVINARGTMLGDKKFVSTFSAELSGKRQARSFIKNITSYIGPLPFDGFWRDAILGELKLSQQGEKINGTFEGGTIEGTVTGKVLNIFWEKATGDKGMGFLSAASNGLLVGMIWSENRDITPETIAAIQVMLPAIGPNSKVGDIPLPKNDIEAQELKYLGYDLSSAGKHQEAARILFTVVTYFEAKAKESANNLAAYGSYLTSQALPIHTLINSAFEASDYPTLIKSIGMAIDLQRRLGKDSADIRSFLDHTEKYIDELNKHAETMDKLAAGFERGLKYISTAGIGIIFEDKPNKSGIKISKVNLDMPASRAGVTASDILEEVNGITVIGMSQEQVSTLLHGDSGTSVLIKLIRNEQPLKLNILRAPLVNLKGNQRDKLTRAMSKIYDIASQSSQDYRAEADDIYKLSKKNTNFFNAFKSLINNVEKRLRSIEDRRLSIIMLSEICLSESQIALGLFKRFVSLQNKSINNGNRAYENLVETQKLDQDEDKFERDPYTTDLDKDLLRMLILITGELDQMRIVTDGRLRLVKKAAEFSSKLANPVQIADSMSKFAGWLDKWRSRMVTDVAKIESLQLSQEFYESYVQILLDMNLPEQALEASESARARAFTDLLASDLTMQTNLCRAICTDGVLFNSTSTLPLSLQEIKNIAAIHEGTLIEYFLLKDSIAIWVISSSGKIDVVRVSININQLEGVIERLLVLMGPNGISSKDGGGLRPEIKELLRWLDENLMTPLENKKLLPTDSKTVVTIVPHRNLFRVPFAALLDEKSKYFIEKHTLSYETALSILRHVQKKSKGNTLNKKHIHLLALVSPDPLPNSEKSPQNTLLSLNETAKLFKKHIAGFYTAEDIRKIYLGQDATEAILRKEATHADVIYFATHAEVNGKDPLKSYIALAKTNEFSGHFRVADVYDLNLQAELTILAACETGGGSISGDGVDGLSRAFTQAGSSALLMSLWKITEETTSLMMIGYHQFWINRTMSKAASLRNAQLELLRAYRTQPNLWAGFVLFGNPN